MGRGLAITGRVTVFGLLVLAVTSGNPLNALGAFAPIPQIFFGLILLVAIFARDRLEGWLLPLLDRGSDRRFLIGAISAALALMAAANVFILDRVPHVTDSVAYLFQAKMLLKGWLAWPAPEVPELFLAHFFYYDGGRIISLFQPGWPAILALGVLVGLPWLVNPILGALMLWPLYRIARRGFGARSARFAVILLLFSPFYVFMSASFMAHTLSALIGLVVLDVALAAEDDPHPWRPVVIGLLLGFLFCVRAYNAVLLLVPLAVALWPLVRRRRMPGRHLLLGGLAALLLGSLQLGINVHLTGDALTFPQDAYFARTEQQPACHRLGFGPDIGCKFEHGQFSFPDGYTPLDALSVTGQRLDSLALNFLGSPLALVLLLVPLAGGPIRRTGAVMYGLLAALVAGYALFYYHGNCFGPRFYYEGVGAMGLLFALGLQRLDRWLDELAGKAAGLRRPLRALVPAMLAAVLLFSVGWLDPKLLWTYKGFRGLDGRMSEILKRADVHGAMVMMPGDDLNYAFGFNFQQPTLDTDVVFARHHFDQSVQLMYAYPERNFYRFEPRQNRLVKVEKRTFEGVIYIEMETKAPPLVMKDGFGYSQWIHVHRPENVDARQLYFKGGTAVASFTVRQYIFEAGEYVMEVEAMKGSYMGDWRLEVNGRPLGETFKGYARDYHFVTWTSGRGVYLDEGPADITFVVVGRHHEARAYGIGIDNMTLRRVPDGLKRPVPEITDIGYMERGRVVPIGPEGIPRALLPGEVLTWRDRLRMERNRRRWEMQRNHAP